MTTQERTQRMSQRAEALADRVEQGARELIAAVEAMSDENWGTDCPGEQRSVGTLVHHVGAAYLAERDLVLALATGQDMSSLTWEMVDQGNAQHAGEHAHCTKEEALDLIRRSSASAAEAIRGLSDEQLDRTVRLRLHWEAPLSVQYVIEQHPVAHPYIHLESIRAALSPARR